MAAERKQKGKKSTFPTGIFFLLFLIHIIASTAGLTFYFHTGLKNNLADIEKYTLNYSKTLAEAFARVAELSFKNKSYSSLKSLFREKIEENTIDEAFFILKDGTLIVHSNTSKEKKLKGNIANDEMSYNLGLILQPVEKSSMELFFSNYNIIDKKIPFNRSIRGLIEKHLYKNIMTSGWLFTKGVFYKNKPVGAVNFLVSKERIYSSIFAAVEEIKKFFIIALAASFFIALVISLIITGKLKKNIFPDEQSSTDYPDTFDDYIPEEEREIVFDDDFDIELPDINEYPSTENKNEISDFEISFDENDPLPDHEDRRDPAQYTDSSINNEEYITIELLGEIDDKDLPDNKMPDNKISAGTKIVASVVIDDETATRKNIPDAIPVIKEN